MNKSIQAASFDRSQINLTSKAIQMANSGKVDASQGWQVLEEAASILERRDYFSIMQELQDATGFGDIRLTTLWRKALESKRTLEEFESIKDSHPYALIGYKAKQWEAAR